MLELSAKDRKAFRHDLDDFFRGRRSGHLDKWAYRVPQRWESLVRAAMANESPYYLATVELPVLEKNAPDIVQRIKGFLEQGHGITTVFERGPGTGEKVVPLIRSLNGSLKSVTFFDIQTAFLEAAADKIEAVRREQNADDVDVTLIAEDFEEQMSRAVFRSNTLGVELGGTILNISGKPQDPFPKKTLTNRFAKLAGQFHKNGFFVVTQHVGNGAEDIVSCYSGDHNRNFALGPLDLAAEVFDTEDYDPRVLFTHDSTYTSHNHLLANLAKVTKEAKFKIDGTWYEVGPSFENSTVNSYKPNEETFLSCAKAFLPVATYHDERRRIAIHLLRLANPLHLQAGKSLEQPPSRLEWAPKLMATA